MPPLLNLEVVEFDGVGVEDLLPLLLREVGHQLLQQVHHLESHQTKSIMGLNVSCYSEIEGYGLSSKYMFSKLVFFCKYFHRYLLFPTCFSANLTFLFSKPACAQLLPLCRQASQIQTCTWLKNSKQKFHQSAAKFSSNFQVWVGFPSMVQTVFVIL